ncbi:MAG TPA: polysaccharide deacetylase family protein [Casimicrobiaceae bacterium]|nr:polysaccharide deacetylase family protein [Casimicrobiaceae bacterium]
MQRPDHGAQVAVVVHDVAPATWEECSALLRMIDDVGARPCTLLVVPDWHRRSPLAAAPRFVAALSRRLEGGDELCLHGYTHLDEERPPHTLRGFVQRRLLTRAEGEFAAIDEGDASARLAQGIATFAALRWPLYGFVPPAWLLGPAARRAIERSGYPFQYVSVRSGIYRLPQWHLESSANLCYSPDRPWRRAASRLMIRRELRRHTPLLRISLHPQDVREPRVLEHWRELIVKALAQRMPVTKHEWAAMALPLAA